MCVYASHYNTHTYIAIGQELPHYEDPGTGSHCYHQVLIPPAGSYPANYKSLSPVAALKASAEKISLEQISDSLPPTKKRGGR